MTKDNPTTATELKKGFDEYYENPEVKRRWEETWRKFRADLFSPLIDAIYDVYKPKGKANGNKESVRVKCISEVRKY